MAATQKKKQQEAPAPQIEARIDRMVDGDYKTKAYASVTIAGAFAVHGLRVIETDKGRFISMPQESYKKNGETVYNDTFHAVTAEARTALVDAVNDAYERRLQERIWFPYIPRLCFSDEFKRSVSPKKTEPDTLNFLGSNKFSTALQVIVLPLPDWPNKIKDSPSLIAKDISETKLSVPDRRLMLK